MFLCSQLLRVQKSYPWSRILSETKVAPAQRSQSNFSVWDCSGMLSLFPIFDWSWSSFKAVLKFMFARSQLGTHWGILPQIIKCIWDKSSSNAVLCFVISMLSSEKVLENTISGHKMSQTKVAPAQWSHSYWNILNWRHVGECYLWPRNVSETKVAPASRS